MKIPQIITTTEDQSLLENLKGLASAQKALANYAAAEGNKISVLITRLEELGNLVLTTDNMKDIKHSANYAVRNAQLMQDNLQSHLLNVLDFLETESMYDLIPLPQNCTCDILARGEGPILNKQDPCYGGRAYLHKADISIQRGRMIRSNIKYRVESAGFICDLECISDGLRIDSLGKIIPRPCLATPNIVLVTGYGVVITHCNIHEVIRRLCWFALTIWDCGGKRKQDKFRMMILTNEHPVCTYDSGIIF